MANILTQAQPQSQYEPTRELPEQCSSRGFLPVLEAGTDQPSECPNPVAARQNIVDYIEMFDNPKTKAYQQRMLLHVDFEVRQQKLKDADV